MRQRYRFRRAVVHHWRRGSATKGRRLKVPPPIPEKFIGDEPMRRISSPAYSRPLFLSIFLLACTPLHAQTAPSAGTTVNVEMLDTVDSNSDPAGKPYRASVTKAVTASNGVAIA